MKLKNLRKKIRRLEKRLREGPKKLAKLRGKLKAMEAAKAPEAKSESATRARSGRRTVTSSSLTEKKTPAGTSGATKPSATNKVPRRSNISPERRAQLAAAMKARWAAKRAVLEATPETVLTDQASTLERTPQASESKQDGA
jgi:hypothetical protein